MQVHEQGVMMRSVTVAAFLVLILRSSPSCVRVEELNLFAVNSAWQQKTTDFL